MSQTKYVYELENTEQDNLWIKGECPKCKSIIVENSMNMEYAYWKCNRCDVTYLVE